MLLPGAALAQAITPIGTIQGADSAATPGPATMRGIVTAIYSALSPARYYVQNEAADADGDPATSDALFVTQVAASVAVGDRLRLRLSGTVQEDGAFPSFGQAMPTGATTTTLARAVAVPAFALLDNATFSSATEAEAFERMRVRFAAPMTVADVGGVRSRGELQLSLRGPVYQPTQLIDPNNDPASGTTSSGNTNAAAVTPYPAANAAKMLLLDDSRATPTATPYFDPALGTVRVGSSCGQPARHPGLRRRPGADAAAARGRRAGPGRAAPGGAGFRPPPPAQVRVASFNIENYFNGDGRGGGFTTPRGALTYTDFRR